MGEQKPNLIDGFQVRKYSFSLPLFGKFRALFHFAMQGETKERWRELCEQAALEQDPDKLLILMLEINRILEEKELRLKAKSPSMGDS